MVVSLFLGMYKPKCLSSCKHIEIMTGLFEELKLQLKAFVLYYLQKRMYLSPTEELQSVATFYFEGEIIEYQAK